MSVSRIRAAIADASRDKRITEDEAKHIAREAFTDASGKPDGLTLAEAHALADLFAQGQDPGATVKVGAPAMRVLDSVLSGSRVPVGSGLPQVQYLMQDAVPFDPSPKLSRAPAVKARFEVPLGKDPEVPGGPERTAYLDPTKGNFYLKLVDGSRTRWAGPLPLLRETGQSNATPQAFSVSSTGGVTVKVNNPSSILLSGGLARGASLSLDFGNGTKVTVNGPKATSYDVYRALDSALPRGFFARTQARFLQESIAERPSTDSRVISVWKGDRPGELTPGDLRQARTLRRLLAGVAEGATTLPAQRPAWDSRAGLFRIDQGKGQALFRVPLASGRTAFVDPRNNRAWFAKEGASHALSAVKGPVSLIGTPAAFGPANRFFTWNELKALESRATAG